jgi:toluene monooxygenase system ferredoxin subunit
MSEVWWPAVHEDDLWEGEMTAVLVDRTEVLLVNVGGSLRAYANECPHQSAPLSEGVLTGEKLTCGRHLWEFDVLTGQGINPVTARLRRYRCETREDGTIYVGLTS